MTDLTRRYLLSSAAAAGAASALLPLATSPAEAAAPPVGKQAPGWYRYKVGDFEVTVVTDGVTSNPLSDAYVANAPKDAVNEALAADYLARDRVTHPNRLHGRPSSGAAQSREPRGRSRRTRPAR